MFASVKKILPYWIAAAITAGVSILFTKLFSFSENFAFFWVESYRQLAFIIVPLSLLLSSLIAQYFSPFSSGSGIPQLLASVEVAHHSDEKSLSLLDGLLSMRMLVAKFFGSCLCVAGGGITGREGPNLQIAAAIFHQIQKLFKKQFHTVAPNAQSMVLAGGAAGLAAAFNTPLGGVVFAIEELAKVHISLIRTYVFHAVIIAGLLTQAILGNYLYFGKFQSMSPRLTDILPMVIASALIGACGSILGSAIVKLYDWRNSRSPLQKNLMTLVLGFGVATVIYFGGRSAAGSGREVIVNLLNHAETPADFSLVMARIFGNLLTYAGGVIGGVFAPALSIGASLGSWLSGFSSTFNTQAWVLMGMVAFLTGLSRTPFTSLVLVLEMTDTHSAILTLMLAAIIAQSAAKWIDRTSFYEHVSYRIMHGKPPTHEN